MRTAMADTSLGAYRELKSNGTNWRQIHFVLHELGKDPKGRTNAEIGDSLGLPASTVAGRVNDLKKSGAVIELGRRTCSVTGNTAKIHGVAP